MSLNIMDKEILTYNFNKDDNRKPTITEQCKSYLEYFYSNKLLKKGLIFIGEANAGKTFYANCIANELELRSYGVLRGNMINLVQRLNQDKENFLKQINRLDLLVVDNFGNSKGKLFMNDDVFDIMNQRLLSGKPIIITTRIPMKTILKEHLHETHKDEIYRLINSVCYPIKL